MPAGPSATSFSAASSATMVMTISRSLQTSATDAAVRAPAFSRSAVFPGVRLKIEQVVAAAQEPLSHALAHAAETDKTDFHERPPVVEVKQSAVDAESPII